MKPVICVLDDNADTLESLSLLLQLQGYDVAISTHPSEALQQIRNLKPAAAIIDLAMPERDGFSVARELREDPATRDLRLIAFSAMGTSDSIRKSRDAGFDYYILKPCDPELLIAALKGELDPDRGRTIVYEFELLSPRAARFHAHAHSA